MCGDNLGRRLLGEGCLGTTVWVGGDTSQFGGRLTHLSLSAPSSTGCCSPEGGSGRGSPNSRGPEGSVPGWEGSSASGRVGGRPPPPQKSPPSPASASALSPPEGLMVTARPGGGSGVPAVPPPPRGGREDAPSMRSAPLGPLRSGWGGFSAGEGEGVGQGKPPRAPPKTSGELSVTPPPKKSGTSLFREDIGGET